MRESLVRSEHQFLQTDAMGDWFVVQVQAPVHRITVGCRRSGYTKSFDLPRDIRDCRVHQLQLEVRTVDGFVWIIDIPTGHRSRHRG